MFKVLFAMSILFSNVAPVGYIEKMGAIMNIGTDVAEGTVIESSVETSTEFDKYTQTATFTATTIGQGKSDKVIVKVPDVGYRGGLLEIKTNIEGLEAIHDGYEPSPDYGYTIPSYDIYTIGGNDGAESISGKEVIVTVTMKIGVPHVTTVLFTRENAKGGSEQSTDIPATIKTTDDDVMWVETETQYDKTTKVATFSSMSAGYGKSDRIAVKAPEGMKLEFKTNHRNANFAYYDTIDGMDIYMTSGEDNDESIGQSIVKVDVTTTLMNDGEYTIYFGRENVKGYHVENNWDVPATVVVGDDALAEDEVKMTVRHINANKYFNVPLLEDKVEIFKVGDTYALEPLQYDFLEFKEVTGGEMQGTITKDMEITFVYEVPSAAAFEVKKNSIDLTKAEAQDITMAALLEKLDVTIPEGFSGFIDMDNLKNGIKNNETLLVHVRLVKDIADNNRWIVPDNYMFIDYRVVNIKVSDGEKDTANDSSDESKKLPKTGENILEKALFSSIILLVSGAIVTFRKKMNR